MTRRRVIRRLLALVVLVVAGLAAYAFGTHTKPPVDPAWMLRGDAVVPDGAVTVRFTGTSTLLFSDGETDFLVDGWFSRFGLLRLLAGRIGPDVDAIEQGLARNGVTRLAAVLPVHSHFDHAMDAPEVARRTGAVLIGSESTANIARGWGLPEQQIRLAVDRAPIPLGRFTLRLIETDHFAFPDPEVRERALASPDIEAPLVPPVPALEYRVGRAYALYVEHPLGRFLVQGSAGFREGGFDGLEADVVFLGVGGLGTQTPEYREAYWRETVTRTGARRVIPIHWDSLTAPIEGPFVGEVRAAGLLSGGAQETLAMLRAKQTAEPGLRLSTLPRYDEVILFAPTLAPAR
ncbi:MAG: MBL fold metallo-hydrolase [Myxococcota bacterium]